MAIKVAAMRGSLNIYHITDKTKFKAPQLNITAQVACCIKPTLTSIALPSNNEPSRGSSYQ